MAPTASPSALAPRRRRQADCARPGPRCPPAAFTCVALTDGLDPVAPGRRAPVFGLPRLDGDGSYGIAQLRGRPAVVTFWASWCRPCAEEARQLESAWRRLQGQGVVVLGINVADAETDARAFLRRHGITYPNVADTGSVAGAFALDGLPETFFLDAAGRLVTVNLGFALGVDERYGVLLRDAIYPRVLDRRLEELLATRPRRQVSSGAEPVDDGGEARSLVLNFSAAGVAHRGRPPGVELRGSDG